MPSRGAIARSIELHRQTVAAEAAFCTHVGGEIIKAMALIRAQESEAAAELDDVTYARSIKIETALGDWLIVVGRPE